MRDLELEFKMKGLEEGPVFEVVGGEKPSGFGVSGQGRARQSKQSKAERPEPEPEPAHSES